MTPVTKMTFAGYDESPGDRPKTPMPRRLALHEDRLFPADATVLMTEKDAVKCRGFGQPGWWWVDLEVRVDRAEAEALLASIYERTGLTGAGAVLG